MREYLLYIASSLSSMSKQSSRALSELSKAFSDDHQVPRYGALERAKSLTPVIVSEQELTDIATYVLDSLRKSEERTYEGREAIAAEFVRAHRRRHFILDAASEFGFMKNHSRTTFLFGKLYDLFCPLEASVEDDDDDNIDEADAIFKTINDCFFVALNHTSSKHLDNQRSIILEFISGSASYVSGLAETEEDYFLVVISRDNAQLAHLISLLDPETIVLDRSLALNCIKQLFPDHTEL